MSGAMKKVFIKTYGCQMNERDSEAVARALVDRGYALTQREEDADVILLNTCSVRDMAEQKALGKMGLMAHLKHKRKPHLVLGFLGCMAQSRGGQLLEAMPAVDLVVGTQKYHRVAQYVDELIRRKQAELSTAHALPPPMDDLTAPFTAGGQILDVAEEPGSESQICGHLNGQQRDVLHFLHCALHARRGTQPPDFRNPAGDARTGRARREGGDAAGADRQPLRTAPISKARRQIPVCATAGSAQCAGRAGAHPLQQSAPDAV
jgi:hypothetical protein